MVKIASALTIYNVRAAAPSSRCEPIFQWILIKFRWNLAFQSQKCMLRSSKSSAEDTALPLRITFGA